MSQAIYTNTVSRRLPAKTKISIALDAIGGMKTSHTAQKHGVCRNSVYTQQGKAKQAIHNAFEDQNNESPLFFLPVTKPFIYQVVLALLLICKSSYRDVIQFIHDIFDYPISVGQIANLFEMASSQAASINKGYDLSNIKNSASDECFHRNKPILAVVDIPSRFCAMLTKEDFRDSDAWGVSLLDIMDQGYQPEVNISDQGPGIKSAYEIVLPETHLRFDHFHMIKASKDLLRCLKNRKESATTKAIALYTKMEKAKEKKQGQQLSTKLAVANKSMKDTQALFENVDVLCTWLQYDVLQLPGNNPNDREMLYDFIIDELSQVEELHHRVAEYVRSLKHQKKHLLAVSHTLHSSFQKIAAKYKVSIDDIWAICYGTRYDIQAPNYHFYSQLLADKIGACYELIEDEVLAIMASTYRCSSMIENFNSRLRPYLDERKQVTNRQLTLYQFILNHRPFQRSFHPHLVGKSPAEALTGKPHLHWLELLGYQRFQQAA